MTEPPADVQETIDRLATQQAKAKSWIRLVVSAYFIICAILFVIAVYWAT